MVVGDDPDGADGNLVPVEGDQQNLCDGGGDIGDVGEVACGVSHQLGAVAVENDAAGAEKPGESGPDEGEVSAGGGEPTEDAFTGGEAGGEGDACGTGLAEGACGTGEMVEELGAVAGEIVGEGDEGFAFELVRGGAGGSVGEVGGGENFVEDGLVGMGEVADGHGEEPREAGGRANTHSDGLQGECAQ